ncbi:hypothetical protein [Muricoccus pecuniae]|uniref:Uncharacterized protein n=1 Tax=Muricoccus pecuniae TaxID=693023 RepID=A0A840Y0R0_9PROT|nr:hypothetical protein [Roseomonas pecuniae]MBB5693736.1 hypothetical protein [Roseomonas pecuniae]
MAELRRATPEEEQNEDFINGSDIVFDDKLGMDHMQKYYTESSMVFGDTVTVFATSVAPGDGTLTAERVIASNGRVFVLVRAPTRKERNSLYR